MSEFMWLPLVLLPMIIFWLIKYYYDYWKRRGIPYVESHPLDLDWYKSAGIDYYAKIYRQLEGHKFGGFFSRFAPKLMIRDPELIKNVLIKDFDYFHDRGDTTFDENEPLTMNMFSAPGTLWRNLRTRLTPTFTSGKMKYMFNLVQECAEELVQAVDSHIQNDTTIDVKNYVTRYSIEVISSCAFGLKTYSIKDGHSRFAAMASKIFEGKLSARIVYLTRSVCPKLKEILRVPFIGKTTSEFFLKLTNDVVEHRKASNSSRNDFVQILINLQDDKKMGTIEDEFTLTDDLMSAQCFLFFVAGYDTSSMTISFALYELAANIEIQKKLQNEIDSFMEEHDDQVSYEMVHNMPYLHKVVSESLRKYSINGTLMRVCVKKYQIPGTEVYIDKGTEVFIPVSGLHTDERYFPDPERFLPERFEDRNPEFRDAYLPFGAGPRSCIGFRFALMSVKLALIYLLRNFNLELCTETRYPFEFAPLKIVTSVKHEIFLTFNKR
uniref:Cytochrome P450 6PW3 n=1 Tax=Maconellicoccus hirsutus TaxID=177089 RepID=A0AAT9UTH1_MACHI